MVKCTAVFYEAFFLFVLLLLVIITKTYVFSSLYIERLGRCVWTPYLSTTKQVPSDGGDDDDNDDTTRFTRLLMAFFKAK
ncbi:unnamed protein product, partial [Ceratitis capitata]